MHGGCLVTGLYGVGGVYCRDARDAVGVNRRPVSAGLGVLLALGGRES